MELEYPEAFQEALLKVLDVKRNFIYVYLGGAFTEQDQEKSLWFLPGARRLRVRPCQVPLCHMLILLRDLPKQNSWSLGSRTSM